MQGPPPPSHLQEGDVCDDQRDGQRDRDAKEGDGVLEEAVLEYGHLAGLALLLEGVGRRCGGGGVGV
jgi:hypothetical protein